MSEQAQRELFNEFVEKEHGPLKRITKRFKYKKRKFFIYIPIENVIFILIVFIVSIIVSFALGVEKGRRSYHVPGITLKKTPITGEALLMSAQIKEGVEVGTENGDIAKFKDSFAEKSLTKEIEEDISNLYTIQLVSYKRRRRAEKEVERLASKGIKAFILSSGGMFKVCAGGYKTIKEAKEALKQFSKNYKDCFVRRR